VTHRLHSGEPPSPGGQGTPCRLPWRSPGRRSHTDRSLIPDAERSPTGSALSFRWHHAPLVLFWPAEPALSGVGWPQNL
jgi:hypothetical protein